jgi:hypothetical protein
MTRNAPSPETYYETLQKTCLCVRAAMLRWQEKPLTYAGIARQLGLSSAQQAFLAVKFGQELAEAYAAIAPEKDTP